MTALPWPLLPAIDDPEFAQALQENFDAVSKAPMPPISYGNGAPAHTPTGRQLYVRQNGGVGSTIYYYNGAGWTAL